MKENNIKKNIKEENLTEKKKRISSVVNSILSESTSKSDPDGHYTGCPSGKAIKPIQDVDDL
ncbi:Uncharacterised protein [[Clostridium] sordellii]|uniref:hypothetical protein n=1 Tax=Paraclostridium sordellii TaxID=1505 RepID=UPI0005E2EB03|nr:hypothetical protein [Paeniclostridium sordellii]CEQ12026.1 Uncharacterised protein [[Clostridium] sordellii] [Paeniclostridium sordellii]